jgi:uncharacterized membrane protein (DUF106 family)
MVFDNVMNFIFAPLLVIPSLVSIMIISFLIALIITLITKYATNQNLMKQLKEEMKELQNEAKLLKKEPEKAMAVQKQVMQTNMKYMKQSFRSMFYTIIPIIIIFGWMNSNLAFDPILPGQDFTTTVTFEDYFDGEIELSVIGGLTIEGNTRKEVKDRQVKWVLNGEEGEYLIEYIIDGKKETKEVLITTEQKYKQFDKTKKSFFGFSPPEPHISSDSKIRLITIDNNEKKLVNLFGWKVGWLGTYIFFSILFSIVVRRIIKVY